VELVIEGRMYRAVAPHTAPALAAWELRRQSGMGMRTLTDLGARIQAAGEAQERGERPDITDAEVHLWMAVLVFLARRSAGERITFAQAKAVPITDVHLAHE
jgi:hypothetical protein